MTPWEIARVILSTIGGIAVVALAIAGIRLLWDEFKENLVKRMDRKLVKENEQLEKDLVAAREEIEKLEEELKSMRLQPFRSTTRPN